MKLHQALEVVRGDVVAFTGAGGKTTAIVSMGYELIEEGWRVLASTTLAIPREQLQLFPASLPCDTPVHEIITLLGEKRFIYLYSEIRNDEVYGLNASEISRLLDQVDSDVLLLETDFADGKPFKAPYKQEPIIPPETSLVVPMMSLAALNKPLNTDYVYNLEPMIAKYGFYRDKPIQAPWLADVLSDDDFALKGIPERARVIAFLNQVTNSTYTRNRARVIARLALKSSRFHGIALGAIRGSVPVCEVQRPVGAVVVAGGKSSRMGQPKVLLPWGKKSSILEHIVQQLLRLRLNQINVVTGYYAADVKRLMKPYAIKTVHNRAYRRGEMFSSLQAGLKAMPDQIGAALVVLGDQPRIKTHIVYKLLSAYAEGQGKLIIPSFQMKRGHPILIDRRYWQEILAMSYAYTLRDFINAHSDEIHYINVNTDSVLRDVDTPADYAAERRRAGLSAIDIQQLKSDAS